MEIHKLSLGEKKRWNEFVVKNYPPVGGFMHTWEWGDFQKALSRKTDRYFVRDGNKILAAFMLVHHKLPMGMSYGYVPRGPVFESGIVDKEKMFSVLESIRGWAKKNFPQHAFIRLEPPISNPIPKERRKGFHFPRHYVQPRFNELIDIRKTEDEITKGFHSSTRSNLSRAERRGATVEIKTQMTKTDYNQFSEMIKDTIKRNSGQDAYPSQRYFDALMETIPLFKEAHTFDDLLFGIFYGYQNGEPASIHFVLFFGDTATYLYGASYSDKLNSKITTYLHWTAIKEAKKRGLKYYDLGGMDEKRWPNLTTFKRQFRGQEYSYIGNIDISIRPLVHKTYNLLQRFKSNLF